MVLSSYSQTLRWKLIWTNLFARLVFLEAIDRNKRAKQSLVLGCIPSSLRGECFEKMLSFWISSSNSASVLRSLKLLETKLRSWAFSCTAKQPSNKKTISSKIPWSTNALTNSFVVFIRCSYNRTSCSRSLVRKGAITKIFGIIDTALIIEWF